MSNNNKINKELLCLYLTINKYYDNFFSKNSLLFNIIELNDILANKNNKKIPFLYFYKSKIEQILYQNDEVIDIGSYIINTDNISDYFYICLLIQNVSNINYIYKINLIRELENKFQKEKINVMRQIIISKIGIELIKNYKNSDIYDESGSDELNRVEKEFFGIIYNNIIIFNQFNLNYTLNYIITKKIDLIYIGIILDLIRQKKFENYDTINILKQLDIEYINLTKKMFDELNNELKKMNIY